MKYAVIDIGTNSTRLYVAELSGQYQHTVLKKLETTRLGEASAQGMLQPAPMTRTAEAAERFAKLASDLGALNVFIYATAAVREAENKLEFAEMIKARSGLPLDIIDGETEALIAYLGAAGEAGDCAVIDIGGGSTEVIIKKDGLRSLSQKLGAVRLMEKWGPNALSQSRINEISAYIDDIIKNYETISPWGASKLIGVSGTPTTLACIKSGLAVYDPVKIQNMVLSLNDISELTYRLCSCDLESRRKITGMPPDRADILQYGCLILANFMRRFGYTQLIVSDDDSLKGYLQLQLEGGK